MSGVGKWRITVRKSEERQFPFDHLFHLATPEGCSCGWVCRTIPAAMRLVDRAEFFLAHPELDLPKGDVGGHVRHLLADQSVKGR